MATGGFGSGGSGDGNENFNEDPFQRKEPKKEYTPTNQDIGDQGRVLLTRFVHDRMEVDGIPGIPPEDALFAPSTPRGEGVMENKKLGELAKCLRSIGDELDGDVRLQTLLEGLQPSDPKQSFISVATQIFSDGQYTWGRVVALFYLAYRMAKRAITNLDMVRTIIEWVVEFIKDRLSTWIIGRGGWGAIWEYFARASPGQSIFVFIAGIVTAAILTQFRR